MLAWKWTAILNVFESKNLHHFARYYEKRKFRTPRNTVFWSFSRTIELCAVDSDGSHSCTRLTLFCYLGTEKSAHDQNSWVVTNHVLVSFYLKWHLQLNLIMMICHIIYRKCLNWDEVNFKQFQWGPFNCDLLYYQFAILMLCFMVPSQKLVLAHGTIFTGNAVFLCEMFKINSTQLKIYFKIIPFYRFGLPRKRK